MLLTPNKTGYIIFEVLLGGEYTNGSPETVVAKIYRNGIETAITTTVNNLETGKYLVSFETPSNWENYDNVSCSFSLTVDGFTIKSHKEVGTVLSETKLNEVWTALMLNPDAPVRHTPNATILNPDSPEAIQINLAIDEINKTVQGTRVS